MKNDINLNSDKIVFDEIGPELIFEVYDPKLGYKGVVVIDNRNLGVAKGGFRMTPEVTAHEVSRLARGMTLKNALAGLPFGGGKGGIRLNSREFTKGEKKKIIQSFAKKLRAIIPEYYISGPDMNIAETEMQWFAEAHGSWDSVTGKPADYCEIKNGKKRCGLPHELGSTGYGVALSAIVAVEHKKIDLKGATVAIAGYGNVGQFVHKFLEEKGAKIIAVSDSRGVLVSKNGLGWKKIWKVKNKKGGTVINSKDGQIKARDSIYEMEVDVLIPAAGSDVIHNKNVNKVKAKVVVQGANIPMKPEHEKVLHKKKVLVIPDIIANSGGVISSYAEYKGYAEKKMFKLIEQKIVPNVKEILKLVDKKKMMPREAALEIAKQRVLRK